MNARNAYLLFIVAVAGIRLSEASVKDFTDLKDQAGQGRKYKAAFMASRETTSDDEENLPDDSYMSYLLWPHFHFSGTYRADVSTINNNPSNYNTASFIAAELLQNPGNWNPKGSAEWSVIGSVTQVCYADGQCVGDDDDRDEEHGEDEDNKQAEPLLGATERMNATFKRKDGGNKTIGKMVDLDSQAQLFSEIWGWRIRIGDLFSADFTPVPFQYIWPKMKTMRYLDSPYGAVYQSVLSNIRWIDNGQGSPLIKQLQKAMNNVNIDSEKLSIRLNIDMYHRDYNKENFTMGRITGTIGLLGQKSPLFFTHGRMMKSQNKSVQDTPFYVDRRHRKIFIDFGNSFQVYENGSIATDNYEGLFVALSISRYPSLTCSDDLLWLGVVYDKYPNWYQISAGVQVIPALGSLSDSTIRKLRTHPLVVAEVSGTFPLVKCKRILLAEAPDGLDIHPYSQWIFRKNPGELARIQLLATKFGRPLSQAKVEIEPCNCDVIFSGGPKVGHPPLPYPPDLIADENGIATLYMTAKDPTNIRGFIDGQLYPFMYKIKDEKKSCHDLCTDKTFFMLLNSLFVIRIWDHYTLKGVEPTWLDDVYPIFKQYADLYPVMTENFVDLGNYYEVVNLRKAIKGSMELQMSHPNYMPVTRDLSMSKREVIIEWLSKEKPLIGDVKNFYSVENLRRDLQTALELEHATISPYLTALASIKYSYNLDIQSILKAIVIQEMMHMALVANILNAVGGKPSLYSATFIPHYPSRLPGGVQPDLVVPIEKLSIAQIRNIFMKIEQPALEKELVSSFQRSFSFVKRRKKTKGKGHCRKSEKGEDCKIGQMDEEIYTDPMAVDPSSECFTPSSREEFLHENRMRQLANIRRMRDPVGGKDSIQDGEEEKRKTGRKRHFPGDDLKIVKNHNTIGAFYQQRILDALGYLTNCGSNNSIFTGDVSRQVDFGEWSVRGHSIKVVDYDTAVEAIELIVDQGEGSNPCNPFTWSTGNNVDLSHYYLFYSVAEEHEIVVEPSKPPHKGHGGDVVDFPECKGTYYFNGSKIPFDPEGVWPMTSNPHMSKYKPGSNAYRQAERFNKVYTKVLKSLDNVFNGRPETLGDALGLMYSVSLHLKNLLRIPIDDDGDPNVGPNAGPTFDFTP